MVAADLDRGLYPELLAVTRHWDGCLTVFHKVRVSEVDWERGFEPRE